MTKQPHPAKRLARLSAAARRDFTREPPQRPVLLPRRRH